MSTKQMNIFDSKSNSLRLLDKKKINWYNCGPTIYSNSHIGHARTFIIFDCIRRWLEKQGYDVKYALNITDIDDKILNKVKNNYWNNLANEKKIPIEELETILSEKELTPSYDQYLDFIKTQEKIFWEEYKSMGNNSPTFIERVSDNIKEIINATCELIKKGYAYESNGSVYFDVCKYNSKYNAKLVDIKQNGVSIKDEFNDEKKDVRDFALWKKSKKYEIGFVSPWSYGRPGWTLECSVLIDKIFKSELDIHSGGIDLKFPHHHNEILQSVSLTDNEQCFDIFLHSGHVLINKEKMSKSDGNVININDFLKKYTVNQLRLLIIMFNWNKELEFCEDTINNMLILDGRIKSCIKIINNSIKNYNFGRSFNESDNGTINLVLKYYENYIVDLNNNFDTISAIRNLQKIIDLANIYTAYGGYYNTLLEIKKKIFDILDTFGIYYSDNHEDIDIKNTIEVIIEIRDKIRETAIKLKSKDLFDLSDWIRDEKLKQMHIQLEDGKLSTTFYKK